MNFFKNLLKPKPIKKVGTKTVVKSPVNNSKTETKSDEVILQRRDNIEEKKGVFRQPKLFIAIGQKGVGKTYITKKIIESYIKGDPSTGILPRKVLVIDPNNEFDYKTISIEHAFDDTKPNRILEFSDPKTPVEVRRVSMFRPNVKKMNISELQIVFSYCLRNFMGGMMLAEDINLYVADTMKNDLAGTLATQRHMNCDIYLHYQMKSKAGNPKLVGFTNIVRLHKTKDNFEKNKKKFEGQLEIYKIAEKLVDLQNKKRLQNATREQLMREDVPIEVFYCYIDHDRHKITCDDFCKFTDDDMKAAIEEYILSNYNEALGEMRNRKNRDGKLTYKPEEVFDLKFNELYQTYYKPTQSNGRN